MSKRNTRRTYGVPAYYHVYNRGVHKENIYYDAQDKAKFLSILARYLDPETTQVRSDGLPYEKSNAKLAAYCLMKNHFHLLLYQDCEPDDIRRLMSAVLTSYSMYHNLRHRRSGRLFEGPYQAVRIDSDAYLAHITRYIHLNPRTYRTYKWSSLPEYLEERDTPWIYSQLTHDMSQANYLRFIEDYEDRAAYLTQVKKELGI